MKTFRSLFFVVFIAAMLVVVWQARTINKLRAEMKELRTDLQISFIALQEGRLDDAKRRLLAAGQSSGSPVLSSFGPNMGLAKDLLEKGEQEAVLRYLEMCRTFWRSEKLDEWIKDIQAGRIPNFGANLLY